MQTEDYEQLDELSKKTLGSYINHAHGQLKAHAANMSFKSGRGDKDALSAMVKSEPKEKRREKGLSRAVDKLTKESVQDFIVNVAGDKNADALQAFHAAISHKLDAAIESKRIEVAQSMIQRHRDAVTSNENT
jgi:hypothetical protein